MHTMRYLKNHPHFSLAERLMVEQYETTSLWGITAIICSISNDTWELYRLFDLLTHSGSDFTNMVHQSCIIKLICFTSSNTYSFIKEVMEKFYCLCTLFLYFHRKFRIPAKYVQINLYKVCAYKNHKLSYLSQRLHYNLRYAINLFENRWTDASISRVSLESSSQQKITAPPLTHEQSRIVNHRIKRDDVNFVN